MFILSTLAVLFSVGLIVALSGSGGGDSRPSPKEFERIILYRDKGIAIDRKPSGCQIIQGKPLKKMKFTLSIASKDQPQPGEVLRTSFSGPEEEQKYSFDKRGHKFNGQAGKVKIHSGNETYWDTLEEAGLLPLSHLSQHTRDVLKRYAVEKADQYIDLRKCLYIVEAIMHDPAPGYEKFKGKSKWIMEFHKDKGEEMVEELTKLKEIHDEEKRGKEEQQTSLRRRVTRLFRK